MPAQAKRDTRWTKNKQNSQLQALEITKFPAARAFLFIQKLTKFILKMLCIPKIFRCAGCFYIVCCTKDHIYVLCENFQNNQTCNSGITSAISILEISRPSSKNVFWELLFFKCCICVFQKYFQFSLLKSFVFYLNCFRWGRFIRNRQTIVHRVCRDFRGKTSRNAGTR